MYMNFIKHADILDDIVKKDNLKAKKTAKKTMELAREAISF